MIALAYFAPVNAPGGPLNYFFGNGIGTNIGAAIVWGCLAGLLGLWVARQLRAAWAGLHSRIDDLHQRHDLHDQKLDTLIARVEGLAPNSEPSGDEPQAPTTGR